jgi:hypothetical protein
LKLEAVRNNPHNGNTTSRNTGINDAAIRKTNKRKREEEQKVPGRQTGRRDDPIKCSDDVDDAMVGGIEFAD